MLEIKELLEDLIFEEKLIVGNFSGIKKKLDDSYKKVDFRPVMIQDIVYIQFTFEYDKKVIHENLSKEEALNRIGKLVGEFKQVNIFTCEGDYQILISKKDKVKILKKKASKEFVSLNHNREKEYILKDKSKIDFLIRLGVMNESGKVYKKKYNKFKQINRFLEMIDDVYLHLDRDRPINIVDFGCGKSYLTFATYYYLVELKKLDVNIIGLDLKEDVIEFCNEVAEDLSYEGLKFVHGDIKDFKGHDKVDMVITLHACDNATDMALVKAIGWKSSLILSFPCCQHELYGKINNPVLNPMIKHGIIKEKLATLVTDSLRGNVLELMGYEVQLLEFIDMEHTPKNTLIRAVKTDKAKKGIEEDYRNFKEFWQLDDLYIEKALFEELGISLK